MLTGFFNNYLFIIFILNTFQKTNGFLSSPQLFSEFNLMKGTKFSFILILLFLIIAAFAVKEIIADKPEEIPLELPVEEPEIDYSLEIKNVLDKYDSLITEQINETGTIGAAVVVTYKNQIAFLKCFGVRKKGESEKVDENTIFRLASVSKTISGVLAGMMNE